MNPAAWGVVEWLAVIGSVVGLFGTFAGAVTWCVTMQQKMSRVMAGVDKINGSVGRHDRALGHHGQRLVRIETRMGIQEELS